MYTISIKHHKVLTDTAKKRNQIFKNDFKQLRFTKQFIITVKDRVLSKVS